MKQKQLTIAQFKDKLAKNTAKGVSVRDEFNELVLDAAHWALGAGDYMGFKATAADSLGVCRGDTMRLQAVIDAAEQVAHINTTALCLWMKTYLPIQFDVANPLLVKWNKKAAGKQTYAEIEQALHDMAATPFWTFRKDTEDKRKLFDLQATIEQMLVKAMANGASADSIKAALDVAMESEEVLKKVQKAKAKLAPALPDEVQQAAAEVAALDGEEVFNA